MSSYKQSKFCSVTCVFCKHRYPFSQQGGILCPKCRLWQPSAPLSVVMSQKRDRLFSRIFVLHLERDKVRWQQFQQSLYQSGTKAEDRGRSWIMFPGVDGKEKTQIEASIQHFFPQEDSTLKTKIWSFWKEKPGTIGCYFSHMRLWEHMFQTRDPTEEFVLVLEDDILFLPHTLPNIESVVHQALQHPYWDILYFGHTELRGKQVSPLFLYPNVHQNDNGTNAGLWCTIYRVSSLPKLLNTVKDFPTIAIDVTMRHRMSTFSALFCVPYIAKHGGDHMSSRLNADASFRNM